MKTMQPLETTVVDWRSVLAERHTHGFLAEIDLDQQALGAWIWHDDFSSAGVEAEGLQVVVQAGTRSSVCADRLKGCYLASPSTFQPPRDIDGSFLIIDYPRRRVLAGRDRTHAFHLYWMVRGGRLFITTSLVPWCGTVSRELDAVACDFFLTQGIVPAPFPLLAGVAAVYPGHWLDWQGPGQPKESVFWSIKPAEVPSSYDEAVTQYGQLLLDTVRQNLKGSTAGVFLSGGSDSAAVVGALHRLGVKNTVAIHMEANNFPTESTDVKTLQDAYGFELETINPTWDDTGWQAQIENALLANQPGSYMTFPMYYRMGSRMGERLVAGNTVFNGEWCLLDQGFSNQSDRTRNLRRWLFMRGGRCLSRLGPLWPAGWRINWPAGRRPVMSRNHLRDWRFLCRTGAQAFLKSVGRPAEYYGGAKLGFRGFPGIWLGLSLLPPDRTEDGESMAVDRFFRHYTEGLLSEEWRQVFATMTTCWYSESSNLTMPLDAAAAGHLSICFPFNSVAMMDFAASLPVSWCVDKRLQKDMCHRMLNMPSSVAYRMKNHTLRTSYGQAAFGRLLDPLRSCIRPAAFGPLEEGVRSVIAHQKLNDTILFGLLSLQVLVTRRGMTIK